MVRNLATLMAGARPVTTTMPVQIQTTITNTASYTFTLPNGDHLLALWSDGVAVDDDPGREATLTLPGLADRAVVGIDPLHGFEQPIVTREGNGSLVIEDLLVKDYPIILRLNAVGKIYLPVVLNQVR